MSVRITRESIESSFGWKQCSNHSDRTASHQLLTPFNDCDNFFCEKCSIMLASQGHNVMKLPKTPHNEKKIPQAKKIKNRKSEIGDFIKNLTQTLEDLQAKNTELQQILIESQSEYTVTMDKVNAFYKQIEEIIELQKYTTYNSILNKRARQEADTRELKVSLEDCINEVQSIFNDIEENMDAVETVEFKIYWEIMKGYMEKLDSISEIRDGDLIVRKPETIDLILPSIPKNLENFAETIILKPRTNTNQNNFRQVQEEQLHYDDQNKSNVDSKKNKSNYFFNQPSQSYDKQNQFDEANSSLFEQDHNIIRKIGSQNSFDFVINEGKQNYSYKPTPQISNEPSFNELENEQMEDSKKTLGAYLNLSQNMGLSSLGGYLNFSQSMMRQSVEEMDTLLIS